MKESNYNKIFTINDKIKCLHNSISGAFFFFSENDSRFSNGKIQVDKLNSVLLNSFKLHMFLINDSMNEFDMLHTRFLESLEDQSFVRITIVPTLLCNLNCKYCFVNSDKIINKSISREGYTMLQNWLEAIIVNKNTKKIFINFYGGEPILKIERIYHIMYFVSNICKKNDKLYAFHLYTNGLLLKKDIIKTLYTYGTTGIQVSLDHQRIIDEKYLEQFLSVLENFVSLKLNLQLTVRINIDSNFYSFLPKLFEKKRFKLLMEKITFYFAPIFEKDGYRMPKYKVLDAISYSTILSDAIKFAFNNYSLDFTSLTHFRKFPCYIQCKSSYVIGPDLNFYSCHSHIAMPEFSVGNLLFNKAEFPLYDPFLDKKCSCCRLLPLCMGECYMRYKHINEHRQYCNITESLLNEMLIIKYHFVNQRM